MFEGPTTIKHRLGTGATPLAIDVADHRNFKISNLLKHVHNSLSKLINHYPNFVNLYTILGINKGLKIIFASEVLDNDQFCHGSLFGSILPLSIKNKTWNSQYWTLSSTKFKPKVGKEKWLSTWKLIRINFKR